MVGVEAFLVIHDCMRTLLQRLSNLEKTREDLVMLD
jgi:hypothetical protein